MAIEKLNEQADAVLTVLQSDLQAAQYQASRAQKQFDAADPENRLVADELERRWNEALQRLHDAEQRLAEHQGTTPDQTDIQFEVLSNLAADLESLWHSDGCSGTCRFNSLARS